MAKQRQQGNEQNPEEDVRETPIGEEAEGDDDEDAAAVPDDDEKEEEDL